MRIPSAMGRSNRPPSLGRSAGARFTVIRPAGNSKRELRSAARTRSLLSFTTVAGRPTTVVKESKERVRSEEHTSELQSRVDLVCRLLLEKKKQRKVQRKRAIQ